MAEEHPAFDYARRDCDDHFRACQIETMAAICAMAEQAGELTFQIKRLTDLLDWPTGDPWTLELVQQAAHYVLGIPEQEEAATDE